MKYLIFFIFILASCTSSNRNLAGTGNHSSNPTFGPYGDGELCPFSLVEQYGLEYDFFSKENSLSIRFDQNSTIIFTPNQSYISELFKNKTSNIACTIRRNNPNQSILRLTSPKKVTDVSRHRVIEFEPLSFKIADDYNKLQQVLKNLGYSFNGEAFYTLNIEMGEYNINCASLNSIPDDLWSVLPPEIADKMAVSCEAINYQEANEFNNKSEVENNTTSI